MARITISLSEESRQKVRIRAADRGISMAALIREAIEEKVTANRPKPKSVGAGASGYTDTARRSGEERPEPRSWR